MAKVKIRMSANYETDYSLIGISQDIVNDATINAQQIEKYSGDYTTHYDYPGLEVLFELISKFEPVPFNKYKKYFHPYRTETFPYQLNDDRIIVIGALNTTFYQNEEEYVRAHQKHGSFFEYKQIPQKDYPITRIHFLPDRKLYYKEIDPTVGEALSKMYPRLETIPDDVEKHYKINRNWLLVHRHILKTYEIYRPEDYEAIKGFWSKLRGVHNVRFPWPVVGRNPYGADFINHVPDLIAKLPDLLNVPEDLCDGSLKSFYTLRKYILMNLMSDEFGDQLYLPLLAYLGQHFVEHHNASWNIEQEEKFDTWIPDIILKDKLLEIYHPVLRLTNPKERAAPDLRGFIITKTR